MKPLIGLAGVLFLLAAPGCTVNRADRASSALSAHVAPLKMVQLTVDKEIDFCPSWSPDGTQIVFASDRSGNRDLWVMESDGSDQRRLTTDNVRHIFPAWSPAGPIIAFSANTPRGPANIALLDLVTDSVVPLTSSPDRLQIMPAWSPDGRRIAFIARPLDLLDDWSLWVMEADGRDARAIVQRQVAFSQPSWSPDGTELVYVSLASGAAEIWVIHAGGANPRQLTDDKANKDHPSWSPDGRLIAFSSDRTGSSEIWVMGAGGDHHRQLTNDRSQTEFPHWSPDGSKIAFVSYRSGNPDIWVLIFEADGIPLIAGLATSGVRETEVQ